MKRSTTAPSVATSRLYKLSPVTPDIPKRRNSHPPTSAPTTPRTMFRKRPSPCLLTIRVAMKPAMRPRTSHAMIDMSFSRCPSPGRIQSPARSTSKREREACVDGWKPGRDHGYEDRERQPEPGGVKAASVGRHLPVHVSVAGAVLSQFFAHSA